jgi:hypothetical protein
MIDQFLPAAWKYRASNWCLTCRLTCRLALIVCRLAAIDQKRLGALHINGSGCFSCRLNAHSRLNGWKPHEVWLSATLRKPRPYGRRRLQAPTVHERRMHTSYPCNAFYEVKEKTAEVSVADSKDEIYWRVTCPYPA